MKRNPIPKDYTLAELLIVVWFGFVASVILFFVGAAIYAVGKYLFGWW